MDNDKVSHREYMVWAKTEYKNDWKYAYEQMCLTVKHQHTIKKTNRRTNNELYKKTFYF